MLNVSGVIVGLLMCLWQITLGLIVAVGTRFDGVFTANNIGPLSNALGQG